MKRLNPFQIPVLVGLVSLITALHYLTPKTEGLHHLLYRELYLLPIFLAAFWYGLRGGLLCSVVISLIYLPSLFISESQVSVHLVGNVAQIVVFNLFALTLGIMRDRDIRRQKELQRTAGLAAMGQAVSSIAHDLKSPLMAVGGFAGQVRRKMDDNDASARKLDLVIAQAARMESMVKDMLAFARPLELRAESTDLAGLLKEAVEVEEASGKGMGRISLTVADDLPALQLDRDRMLQAVLNLLNNALEASPDDGEVTVVCTRNNGKVQIEIKDSGPGIAPAKEKELFTPFVTTKKEGTGLGLPITKKIMEAHGGSLTLKASSAEGTCFLIEVPVGQYRP